MRCTRPRINRPMKKAHLPSADLEASLRSDAIHPSYARLSAERIPEVRANLHVQRIGPSRDLQVSGYNGRARPLGTFLTGLKTGFFQQPINAGGLTMSLEDFNQELKEKNLIGYWMIPTRSDGFREPQPGFEPFLWKWGEVEGALGKACEYIRPEEAFRRFIGFQHPKLKMGTAHTLLMGAQMVRPGEVAPPHRH